MQNKQTYNYVSSRNTNILKANRKLQGLPDPTQQQKTESQTIIQRFFFNLHLLLKCQNKTQAQMIRELKASNYIIHKATINAYRKGTIQNASLAYLLIYSDYIGYSLQDMLFTDLSEADQQSSV
jgi:hypothetical protein